MPAASTGRKGGDDGGSVSLKARARHPRLPVPACTWPHELLCAVHTRSGTKAVAIGGEAGEHPTAGVTVHHLKRHLLSSFSLISKHQLEKLHE